MPDLPLRPPPQLRGAEHEPPVVDRVHPPKHPVEIQSRSRIRKPGVHHALLRSTIESHQSQSASLVARRIIPKVPAFRESPQRIAVPVEFPAPSMVDGIPDTPTICRTTAGRASNTIIVHTHHVPEAVDQCRIGHVEVDATSSNTLQSFRSIIESEVSPLQGHRKHRPDVGNRDHHVDLPRREATEERPATRLRRVRVMVQEGSARVSLHGDRRPRPDPAGLEPAFDDETTGHMPLQRTDPFPGRTIQIGRSEPGDRLPQAGRGGRLNRHGDALASATCMHRRLALSSHGGPICKPYLT